MLNMVIIDAVLQETMFIMLFSWLKGVVPLVPLKSLSLDSQRVKKLALKLHAHSVHYAHKLVQTRRFLEHSPHLQTNQEKSASLSARNPPDPH